MIADMGESVWVEDRNITECQQYKKPLSVARKRCVYMYEWV